MIAQANGSVQTFPGQDAFVLVQGCALEPEIGFISSDPLRQYDFKAVSFKVGRVLNFGKYYFKIAF
jgi:hypothetical protein